MQRAAERCTSRDFIGLPLGVMEGFPYEVREVSLEPGDSVLIFSDGVTGRWTNKTIC